MPVIATDTATICIYDLGAMKHRVDDAGDWWSIPANEMAEIIARNALFLNVGDDGSYEIEVTEGASFGDLRCSLRVPSGRVFIGPGEEMTGGGFEPTGEWGGFFVALDAGDYEVSCRRDGNLLQIGLRRADAFPNEIHDLVRI